MPVPHASQVSLPSSSIVLPSPPPPEINWPQVTHSSCTVKAVALPSVDGRIPHTAPHMRTLPRDRVLARRLVQRPTQPRDVPASGFVPPGAAMRRWQALSIGESQSVRAVGGTRGERKGATSRLGPVGSRETRAELARWTGVGPWSGWGSIGRLGGGGQRWYKWGVPSMMGEGGRRKLFAWFVMVVRG